MSPLVVLGSLGTLISTITIVPHVLHALRTKTPGGSPLAWGMGVAGSAVWLVYGIASHDLLVGAPGVVTVPCGLFLAASSTRAALVGRRPVAVASLEPEVYADGALDPEPALAAAVA